MDPTEFLDRILFATRYTRYLDKNGFLRFQNWKFYGERGLAKAPVTIWVYEGSLKIEHQAVMLSKYTVELQDDHKHLRAVSHPRLQETPFRSPQLTLIDLGPGEWLLYWLLPQEETRHFLERYVHPVSSTMSLQISDIPHAAVIARQELLPTSMRDEMYQLLSRMVPQFDQLDSLPSTPVENLSLQ